MIQKQGEKYIIKSEDGKKTLGTYNTKEEAEKGLQEKRLNNAMKNLIEFMLPISIKVKDNEMFNKKLAKLGILASIKP